MAAPTLPPPEKTPANATPVEDSSALDSRDDIDLDDLGKKPGNSFDHVEDGEKAAKYEQYINAGLNEEDSRFLISFSKAEERAIYRKVDWRVVPMLAMLYLISHLDRANIGKPAPFLSYAHSNALQATRRLRAWKKALV